MLALALIVPLTPLAGASGGMRGIPVAPAHLNSPSATSSSSLASTSVGDPSVTNGTSVWSQMPSLPVQLTDFAVTYDGADQYVLLFGGLNSAGNPTNSTWTYSNGSWTNITALEASSPTPRYSMELAYDPSDGYVVGYGGITTTTCGSGPSIYCNDTWEFSHGQWTELHPQCDFPGLGISSCSTYPGLPLGGGAPETLVDVPSENYVLLYTCWSCIGADGGADYTFHNDTWTELVYNYGTNQTYYAPTMAALAYDSADGSVLGFGGGGGQPFYNFGGWLNVTYRWLNGTWTNESGNLSVSPGPRIAEALASDPTSGGVLLYGGYDFVCQQFAGSSCSQGYSYYLNDTWLFVNGSWSKESTLALPGHLVSTALADPSDGGVLMVGGMACAANCTGQTATSVNGTWLWGTSPPLASLTASASPSAVDVGSSVRFNAAFLGGTPPTRVEWNFGDGGKATGGSVTHAFSTPGVHTVVVWVNDSASHTLTQQVSVSVSATLALAPTASPNPVDAGYPAEFSAGVSGGILPVHYDWSYGDGATGTYNDSTGLSHNYAANGSYTVSVYATDAIGATANASFVVTVNPALRIVALNATPSAIVLGRPVNFTTTVAGGTAPYVYAWKFGDGGIGGDLRNITHIYTTNGPFVAVVTVTDAGGGVVTSSLNVTVALNASASANGSLGAAPLLLAFQGNATGGVPGYSYLWDFGDGVQSTLPDPTHTFASAGAYDVTLEVQDQDGHSAQAVRPIHVFPGGGGLRLGIEVSRPSLIVGESTNITALPQGGYGRYTLTWTAVPSGCRVESELALQCTAGVNGTYGVSASLTDAHGAFVTAGANFTVGPLPGAPRIGPAGLWESPLLLGLIVAIAAAALVGGAIYATRRRRPPSGTLRAETADRYAAYRAPITGPSEPPPPSSLDPLDDIF